MPVEFLTFQKFNDPILAEEIATQLKQANIESIIKNEKPSFDPSFTYNETEFDYVIKLRPNDFEKANKILDEFYSDNLTEVDKDYYLLEFSDDQLKEIVSKPDEWGKYDYHLAKKMLKDRNINMSDEKLTELKKERLAVLSKPEKSGVVLLICGFISAILLPLVGTIISAVILSSKKTLPNGDRVWVYTENNRKYGLAILTISIITFVLTSFIDPYRILSLLDWTIFSY
jgi:hypothetical protein